jgi:hypothetical protein
LTAMIQSDDSRVRIFLRSIGAAYTSAVNGPMLLVGKTGDQPRIFYKIDNVPPFVTLKQARDIARRTVADDCLVEQTAMFAVGHHAEYMNSKTFALSMRPRSAIHRLSGPASVLLLAMAGLFFVLLLSCLLNRSQCGGPRSTARCTIYRLIHGTS